MLQSTLPRIIPRILRKPISIAITRSTISIPAARHFSQSTLHHAKDPKMPTGPPKHEMVYFPNMTGALPSESAEFRRVLWTGLYSQVVLMTVPVGGDIGDEVRTLAANPVPTPTISVGTCKISRYSTDDLFASGPHSRPSSNLHIRHRQSDHRGQRPRRQSWRSDGRAGWYAASIR